MTLLGSCDGESIPFARGTRVVVVGDSVARGAGDESRRGLPGLLPAANLGIDGARTWNVLRLLRTETAIGSIRDAGTVVVSIGGNDLYGDTRARLFTTLCATCTMSATLTRIEMIVGRIHRVNPSARIVLLGLYNPYGLAALDRKVNEWDARLIERFQRRRYVDVVRIADEMRTDGTISPIDRFHPSARGYGLIANRIAPLL